MDPHLHYRYPSITVQPLRRRQYNIYKKFRRWLDFTRRGGGGYCVELFVDIFMGTVGDQYNALFSSVLFSNSECKYKSDIAAVNRRCRGRKHERLHQGFQYTVFRIFVNYIVKRDYLCKKLFVIRLINMHTFMHSLLHWPISISNLNQYNIIYVSITRCATI